MGVSSPEPGNVSGVALLPDRVIPVSLSIDRREIKPGLVITREYEQVMVNLTLYSTYRGDAVCRTPLHGTYYGWLIDCPPVFDDEDEAHRYATEAVRVAKSLS